jgi:MYXO-CTERM domain-containing protein
MAAISAGALLRPAPAMADPTLPAKEDAKAMVVTAMQLFGAGKYDEAISTYERALALWDKAPGPASPGLLTLLSNLAVLYRIKGDYARAEQLFQRSITARQAVNGPLDRGLVGELINLGRVYQDQGDYKRAEPYFTRALSIAEELQKMNPKHLVYPLQALADLYEERGDHGRAEPLLERALAIIETITVPGHIFRAVHLLRMGRFYRSKGNLERARPLLEEALAIFEERKERSHADYVDSLDELGAVDTDLGDYARARPLLEKALAMAESSWGPESPTAARCADDLGVLLLLEGEKERAGVLFAKALAVREKKLGPTHLDVARTLSHTADLALLRGELRAAIAARQKSAVIKDHNAALMLAVGSEAQKRLYMAKLTADTHAVLSLHNRFARSDPAAAELALTTILRRKGRVLDVMVDSFAAVRSHLTARDRILLDRLAAVSARLSAQASRGPGDGPDEHYRRELERLEAEREELEARVSERSSAFRADHGLLKLDQVRRALAEDTALLELFRYRPVIPGERAPADRGEPRYVAYLLRSRGDVAAVDLGAANPIDAAVTALRAVLSRPTSDPKPAARALDARIMQPVRALLGDVRRVLVSPDGPLNLVPFGTLVDEEGRYLIERFSFTYLTSGRDLVRLQTAAPPRRGPLVVAAPDFGRIDRGPSLRTQRGEASGAFAGIEFPPLPGTIREGRAISSVLGSASLLTGATATEHAIKSVSAPSILHIATHGFFLPDQTATGTAQSAFGAAPIEGPLERHLLRSGIALSGANARRRGEDDGVLTALEASALDLYGTKLIVLSACETGVGEVTSGEGVFGLRRALVMAGAETQVMSLWHVDDDATAALMVAYYNELRRGGERSEALRHVQGALLEKRRTRHPYYWASFIVSGAGGPIEGVRSAGTVAPGVRGCSCRLGDGGADGSGLAAVMAGIAALARRRSRRRR